MHWTCAYLLLSAFISTFEVAWATPITLPITLEDAVRSALQKTEAVPIGESRVEQSEARLAQMRSRFLPTVAFEASIQQQDTRGLLATQSSSLFGGTQSYSRFGLTQSIFEGWRDMSGMEVSRSDVAAQKQSLTQARIQVFSNVAAGFYSALTAQTDKQNLNIMIGLARDRVKEIANREKIGRSRKVELSAAQAQVSVLESQRMAAEGQWVTAMDQFILLTSLPRDIHLIESAKFEIKKPTQDLLQTYLDRIEQRPDIAVTKAQLEGARRSVEMMRSGHLPSINAAGNVYLSRTGTQQGNVWDVGMTLSWPIFAGGLVSARVGEASAREKELEQLLSQTRRLAETSIRTAYNQWISALNQIQALEAALNSTEENYKEQSKNYRFGQATNLDVIQALNVFQDTKRTLERTRIQARAAFAELRALTADEKLFEAGNPS